MSPQTPLVVLTSGDPQAWAIINLLRSEFGNFPILLEEPESPRTIWRRRLKRFGLIKVASMQAARLALGLTRRGTDKIINKIQGSYRLNPELPRLADIRRVGSVNSNLSREYLRALNPKAVFVIASSPLEDRTLETIDVPFINFNPGINPAYRGVFGGYFALAKGEPELFGGTVHLLTTGPDTGEVLYQSRVSTQPGDNIHTYMWRITACSRGIILKAIRDALDEDLKPRQVSLPSRQFDTPTLGYYLWTGLTRKVW